MKNRQHGFGDYLQTLYHHTRTRLPLALGLLLAVSLTEGIGLMLLLPLLTTVGMETSTTLNNPIATSVHTLFTRLNIPFALVSILAVFFLLILLRAMLTYWRDTYLLTVQLEFVDTLRAQLHTAFGKAHWSFLMKQRSSDFAHVLTNDIARIGFGTYVFLQMVVSASLASAYLLTSLYLSLPLTLLVMLTSGALLGLLRKHRHRALQLGKEQTTSGQAVFAAVNEFLGGIKLVKSYGAETHYLDYFQQAATTQRHKQLAFKRSSSLAQQVFQMGSALLLCLFFYVALALLHIPTSQLLVLALIFVRLMPLLSGLQHHYEQITHMLPAYANAMQLQQECQQAAETQPDPSTRFSLQQGITLQNVTFGYTQQTPVFQHIHVCFPASQTTAIMGASGTGKSTLADMLAGLILPDSGNVMIDDTPLTQQNLLAWRSHVAYVPQEVFLFHDTLRANMRWVDPTADDDQLWAVLELAAARPFVEKLPQGLDTVIGERGIRLSGGERQRLALARALLRKPALLILDEATSALDHDNEQKIKDSLRRLHGSMTIVLIAHRLTTVESADRILSVQNHAVTVVNHEPIHTEQSA